MTRLILPVLCGLAAMPTPLSAAPRPGETVRSTQRTMPEFRDCFIASQEKAGRPWAYVPNEGGGGSFSTVPESGGESPYFLSVGRAGASSRVALTGEATAGSGPTITAAVDQCLTAHAHAPGQAR